MAHEDNYDMETSRKANMTERIDSRKNVNKKKIQKEYSKDGQEDKKNNSDETSPSNDTSSSFKRIMECIEIIKDGYTKMDVDRLCEPLAENVIWMEHPHDVSRHYEGLEKVRELLREEFENIQETKIILFQDSILHDEKQGAVHVEWLKSRQDTTPDGNHRERHSSHSVLMKFENDQIQMIKFHSIKTNKYWTKPLVENTLGNGKKKKRRNGKGRRKGRNGHRNGKNGKNGRRKGRRNGRNGRNGRRNGKNGRKRQSRSRTTEENENSQVIMNSTENITDVLEKPKPVAKSTSKSASRSQTRGNNSRGRGRNNGHYRNGRGNNYARNGRNSRYRNGRYKKRGGRGRGRRGGKKKLSLPWKCSKCQTDNTAAASSCASCSKPFDFNFDLTEEQKMQHWSVMGQESNVPVDKNESGMMFVGNQSDSVSHDQQPSKKNRSPEKPVFDSQNDGNGSKSDQKTHHKENKYKNNQSEDDHKEAENNAEPAGNYAGEN